jgi:ABC-type Fe3+-hydroxamate transport system substrate-binding protein
MKAPRVVSLVPSATETLLDWKITPTAVSRFCEHPELREVGGTKDPDITAIVAMRPDLVVMCDQENRREDYEALCDARVNVFAFSITHLDHVNPQLVALSERVDSVYTRADQRREPIGGSTSVFVPIWKRPWMTINGDTYGSSLLAAAGFTNIFAEAMTRYPEVTLEEIADKSPEFVLAPSEPYPFAERHRPQLEPMGRVEFVDGKDVFWWGTRTPGALSRLNELYRTRCS